MFDLPCHFFSSKTFLGLLGRLFHDSNVRYVQASCFIKHSTSGCFHMFLHDADDFKRNQDSWFSHEITLMFKCHRGHSGHSLGDTSGPRQHPPVRASPALSSPHSASPGQARLGQPLASPTHSPPSLPDSGTGQRGPLQAEHARGDHAQRGACCGGVRVAGLRTPWVGWGRAAELRHSQAHPA